MGTYYRYGGYRFASYFPRGVKWLLIVNSAIFIVTFFVGLVDPELLSSIIAFFGLRARSVIHGAIWQPFTYMFLHNPGGFGHILFNMLTLWMFGADLERDWGTERFLKYYVACGMGAGICDVAASLAFSSGVIPTIGASGAIYGILLAFGLLYPNRTVFFSFLFPIPARWFVLIMGVIAFMSSFDRASSVSNIAHLGGMVFGYLYLRFRWHQVDLGWTARTWYQQWRRRRLQHKFKVYMRKQERDPDQRDRWVN